MSKHLTLPKGNSLEERPSRRSLAAALGRRSPFFPGQPWNENAVKLAAIQRWQLPSILGDNPLQTRTELGQGIATVMWNYTVDGEPEIYSVLRSWGLNWEHGASFQEHIRALVEGESDGPGSSTGSGRRSPTRSEG